MKKTLLALTFALGTVAAHAADKDRIPVAFDCTHANDDFVGIRLCTALRDRIAKSPRYYEVSENDATHFGIHLVSLSVSEALSAQAVSVTVTAKTLHFYLDTQAYTTGSDKVATQADAILAAMDDDVTEFTKAWNDDKK